MEMLNLLKVLMNKQLLFGKSKVKCKMLALTKRHVMCTLNFTMSRLSCRFVTVVSKYLNFVTFLKGFVNHHYISFCPSF
jgi:hypothetical protein